MLIRYFTLFLILVQVACFSNRHHDREIKHWRQEKIVETTRGDRHPLMPGDEVNLRFYPIQKVYKLNMDFTPDPEPRTFEMPTYSGKVRPYQTYGSLTGVLNGQNIRLEVYQNLTLMQQEKYKNHLFLPFKDATNAVETYGGGRYIDLDLTQISGGKLTVDFNKAYNPWCAYSDGYNCPVPPTANHLSVRIEAGERQYAGEKKH